MAVISKDRLEASLCRDSFFDFVQRFWSEIIPETPVWNWHVRYLCNELQELAEQVFIRKPKKHDLIINISPGTTKSTICSIMFPAWCWTRDQRMHTICGSYAMPLSLHLATQCRWVLQSDKFRRLFPEVVLQEEQKGWMVNSRGGQRISTSTGAGVTGKHAHIIIIDDPINPKEALSDVAIKTANEWFDHTLMTRKVDKALTPLVLIMQRLHQIDPTGHLLQKKEGKIRHICLPAELSDNVKPAKLRRKYLGGLFDTKRLSAKILRQAKSDLGEYAYAGQFMQDPIPAGGGMFRVDFLQISTSTPKLVDVVRYWDKAGTQDGGAWTVGLKMGVDVDKKFWILDVVRGQWEASTRERIIAQTANMDGKTVRIVVEQEPGSGGKESAQGTLKRLAGFRVHLDRPVGDKVLRADPFAVQVNGGNAGMVVATWNATFLEELRFFPFSQFKDQVDAASGAFAQLTRKRVISGAIW
jgi:predicted phage terminase large subunit-like protein